MLFENIFLRTHFSRAGTLTWPYGDAKGMSYLLPATEKERERGVARASRRNGPRRSAAKACRAPRSLPGGRAGGRDGLLLGHGREGPRRVAVPI